MKMKILILNENKCHSMFFQSQLLRQGLLENGIDCQWRHFTKGSATIELEWFYRNFKPDIVLGVGWWVDAPWCVSAPRRFGIQPVPWFVADGWVANYQSLLSSLPLVFVTSQWVKETYARDGVDVRNFEVLPIGYDPQLFKPIPRLDSGVREIRKMLGIKDEEKMILTIGGDVTSKGAQEMFHALSKIDNEYPYWKYVCKVMKQERTSVHRQKEAKLIEELDLKKKIVYLEGEFSREFLPYLMNACDIYAAPSRQEGFGMVQLEAMACGKPVISIDAMGPKDTVIHGKTGFLAKVASTVDLTEEWVTPEMGFDSTFKMKFDKPKTLAYRADVGGLAQFTLQLLTDDKLREKIGQQAAQHALANFQYQDLAKRCIDILQRKFSLSLTAERMVTAD